MDEERMRILQMIEEGRITASEGLRLIQALSPAAPNPPEAGATAGAAAPPPAAASPAAPAEKSAPPRSLTHWKNWWLIPLWIGVGITTVGALLMYGAYVANHTLSFWFWVATVLVFAPGVTVMALAASSRNAKWLHLRVRGNEGNQIALSFPIPIRLTAWFLRTFGRYIPNLKNTGVDELILAVEESTSPENPLYVEVDDDEDGEKVQVYIG